MRSISNGTHCLGTTETVKVEKYHASPFINHLVTQRHTAHDLTHLLTTKPPGGVACGEEGREYLCEIVYNQIIIAFPQLDGDGARKKTTIRY